MPKQNVAMIRKAMETPKMTGTRVTGFSKFGSTPTGGAAKGMTLRASGDKLFRMSILGPEYVSWGMMKACLTVGGEKR